jgi:DNA-binding NtrC family response regulator
VAATNRDLQDAIQEKLFREDLFYRLNVFPIEIPPLRERRADILPLAHHFTAKLSSRMGQGEKALSRGVEQTLLSYGWPGNIRELQNAMERALIVSQDTEISIQDLPLQATSTSLTSEGPMTLADIERLTILETLENNGGDRKATATQLGISLRTLQYRLKDYGLTGQ